MVRETFISFINLEVLYDAVLDPSLKCIFHCGVRNGNAQGENQHSLTGRDVSKLKISIFTVI